MTLRSLHNSLILTICLPLIAGVDREFVFDIHDATSATEQYSNEALIIPVYQAADGSLVLSNDFAGVLPTLLGQLPDLLQASAFKATSTTIATFSDQDATGGTITIIASGLGVSSGNAFSLEAFRRCFGRALCQAERNNIQTVHVALPPCVDDSMKEISQEIAAITHLALYEYNLLNTAKTPYAVKRVCVHAHMQTPHDFKDVNIGLRIGSNLGSTICQTRDWINTPANLMTPTILGAKAAQYLLPYIAKIETIVFEQQDITRMGMGGLLGASQGSDQPCTLVMHYLKSRYPNVPTIALIGNGLNNDTNNPSVDISGAAAVLTALNIIAYRNIPVNILVLAPLAQNAVGDATLQPSDVVTMYNKMRVEITNTNAADRLMIADAISYAIKHYKPDYIIDIATFTTTNTHIFGGLYAAIMSNNDPLLERARQSAARTGESVWKMPLNDDYTARLQSNVADLSNASRHNNGAAMQLTGSFLQQFVGNIPWLHIDISGAKTAPEYSANGLPAFGVRLLVDLVESLAKKN